MSVSTIPGYVATGADPSDNPGEHVLFATMPPQQPTPPPASFNYPTGGPYSGQVATQQGGTYADSYARSAWHAALAAFGQNFMPPMQNPSPAVFDAPVPTAAPGMMPAVTDGETSPPPTRPERSYYAEYSRLTANQFRVLVSLKQAEAPLQSNEIPNPYRNRASLGPALRKLCEMNLIQRDSVPFLYSLVNYSPEQITALRLRGQGSSATAPWMLQLLGRQQ
jgi:hypothetical protein